MTRPIGMKDSVQYLKGVGPARAELLGRLGVSTPLDLLYLIPRDYLDLTQVRKVGDLFEESVAIVEAKVTWVESRMTRGGIPILEIECSDGSTPFAARWFHRPDLKEWMKAGLDVELTGKPKRVDGNWVFTNPKIRLKTEALAGLGIVPIYPLTEGLSAEQVRSFVGKALEGTDQLQDGLPASFRKDRNLPELTDSLFAVHQPTSMESLTRARHRLIYDEFLQFQLALGIRRRQQARRKGHVIRVNEEVDRRIRRLFPFTPTDDQNKAIAEVARDLAGPHPMHRLLLGDVGTGKTAVAIYAILATIASGFQAAFLAPTEILARQQFDVLDRYLAQSRVRRRLLTGGLSSAERSETIDALFRNDVDLVVGTHALLQPDVRFASLGLVVIDEQHKFGVRQRADLLAQDVTPHQLVMTATPIPRSLAMTWFGDLDLSILKERPPGRGAVTTHIVAADQRERAYEFFANRARRGMRGIVVCSRIQEGEGRRGAEGVFEEMKGGRFRDLPLGLVHGKMDDASKNETVRLFRRGDVTILVATVVVEVGLDVPDASMVLIENAERFGLSQLHQIRGRVGRGDQPGICFLLDYSEGGPTRERLAALASINDGFELAELDARLRGTGDLMGEQQHGFIRPRIGDFQADLTILEEARRDAGLILDKDPTLDAPEWKPMRSAILQRFGKQFGIALIG